MINLVDGTFRPGSPGDYIKIFAPHEWTGIATAAPRWESFLSEIFDGDTKLIKYLQRLCGYGCTGQSTEHKYPIAWGTGRNGKGTMFETLGYVLGDLAGPMESEMLLMQKFFRQAGSPSSDVMSLRGKRLVWASEIAQL